MPKKSKAETHEAKTPVATARRKKTQSMKEKTKTPSRKRTMSAQQAVAAPPPKSKAKATGRPPAKVSIAAPKGATNAAGKGKALRQRTPGGHQMVYSFSQGKAEGDPAMRDILGGKGAGLAGMARAGVPVPPGYTITTEVCNLFYEN